MNKKTWKPYAAIVLILLYGVDIFWLSGFCVYYFGEWGIPMYEGLLAVLALGIVVLFREDVKRAFPFHRPTIAKTVGTLLMWIGTLLITMIPTSILLYVFPEQMSGATESVSELSGGLPFGLAFLLCILFFLLHFIPREYKSPSATLREPFCTGRSDNVRHWLRRATYIPFQADIFRK